MKRGHSKYKNKKVETAVDGKFDSQKEYKRWKKLKELEAEGKITHLEKQVRFDMFVNGFKVCAYIADFSYMQDGKQVVEDVKSDFTRKDPVYRLKNKLMWAVYHIKITEVL